MGWIKLTDKENEEVYINLNQVAAFVQNGKGTKVLFENGSSTEVKESQKIVEYLLENYVLEINIE